MSDKSDKLDRFTRRARQVLTLAQQEAMRLNHDTLGTEHLLLGLMYVENSVAAQVVQALGVEPGHVVRAVERSVPPGESQITRKPTLSPLSKKCIEFSVDEARLMGHHYIGSEHLLLGLMRLEQGMGFNILLTFGIDQKRVRSEMVRQILQGEAKTWRETGGASPMSPHSPPSPTPLEPLRHDLTELAIAGRLDPLIGRQKELEALLLVLSRRHKNNPVLIGEPGVGKRALVRGLAQRMAAGEVPPSLLQRHLLVFDVDNLVTSVIYRGLVERRLEEVLEKGAAFTSILFIDNIHRMVAAAGSNIEMINIVKLALNRGELQVIGATTPKHFKRYIDTEAAREWNLQPVEVKEASLEETIMILQGMKGRYEAHHQLVIEDEALNVAAHLATRYIPDHFLPDKAIDLIDEASSRVRLCNLPTSQEMGHGGRAEVPQAQVSLEDIAEIVSIKSGIAVQQLVDEERARLQGGT